MAHDLEITDPKQIFQTYMMFSGDVAQTAVVMHVERSLVENLEANGGWKRELLEVRRVSEGKDPREYKLAVNRAVNYMQADRLRRLVDLVLTKMGSMSADDVMELLTTTGPKGSSFSTRPLTDLVKAAEAGQLMTRLALGDVGAGELAEDAKGGSEIALAVMKAMQAAGDLQVPISDKDLLGA